MAGAAAGHADVAAVGLGQRLGDCQADAGASACAVPGGVGAVEALEDVRQVLGRDAVSVIGDGERDVVAFADGGERSPG